MPGLFGGVDSGNDHNTGKRQLVGDRRKRRLGTGRGETDVGAVVPGQRPPRKWLVLKGRRHHVGNALLGIAQGDGMGACAGGGGLSQQTAVDSEEAPHGTLVERFKSNDEVVH